MLTRTIADAAAVKALLELMRRRADSAGPRGLSPDLVRDRRPRFGSRRRTGCSDCVRPRKSLPLGVMLAVHRAMALEQWGTSTVLAPLFDRSPPLRLSDPRNQIAWMKALSAVGQLEERTGRVEDAIASYRRFLDFLEGRRSGLPDVVRVRTWLRALLSRSNRSRE